MTTKPANGSQRAIIITSINPPTKAVEKLAALEHYQLIVVGDKKSPADWQCNNTRYLSVEEQQRMGSELAKHLPYNNYGRKMLGYIEALRLGCSDLIDIDDDNIPKEDWQFPALQGEFDTVASDLGMVNMYQLYSKQMIWPRGLPLSLIRTDSKLEPTIHRAEHRIGIWQGLADGDPDVDAIYRLCYNNLCYFDKRAPVVLPPGTVCPCNTQNTLTCKELIALMYLPVTMESERFTDILRGLVAQAIMWTTEYRLGFLEATVLQERNPHNYMKDFIDEISMYRDVDYIIEWIQDVIKPQQSLGENLRAAYVRLREKGVVEDFELTLIDAWLEDIERFSKAN